ncbi:homoserine kinase, partial [Rhizobium johnstonii]
NDLLAYDCSICLNAWCFEKDGSYNITKGTAMLEGYQSVRPLSDAEISALPESWSQRKKTLSGKRSAWMTPAGRLSGQAA